MHGIVLSSLHPKPFSAIAYATVTPAFILPVTIFLVALLLDEVFFGHLLGHLK